MTLEVRETLGLIYQTVYHEDLTWGPGLVRLLILRKIQGYSQIQGPVISPRIIMTQCLTVSRFGRGAAERYVILQGPYSIQKGKSDNARENYF